MSERKKKKRPTKLTINPIELIRSLRKPQAPGTKVLKDKRRYTRKEKHKRDFREEE
jgi:hypothetical protein